MANEDLGKAVLTLSTDPTQLKAGLDKAKQDILTFKKEAEAAGQATTAAFKNAISPVSPQTSDSFRRLFTDVRLGATSGSAASDAFRSLFTTVKDGAGAAGPAMDSFGSNVDSLWKRFGNLKTAVQGFLALQVVEWITGSIAATLNYADSLENLSAATGIGVSGLQDLEAIGVTSHTSLDTLARSVEQLQKHLDDPAAIKAIKDMGLNYAYIRTLKPEDQFFTIARAISAIKDPVEQANAGAAVFARTWPEIAAAVKSNIDETIKNTKKLSDEQVKALDDAGDAWDKWKHNAGKNMDAFLGEWVLATQKFEAEVPRWRPPQPPGVPPGSAYPQVSGPPRLFSQMPLGSLMAPTDLTAVKIFGLTLDEQREKMEKARAEAEHFKTVQDQLFGRDTIAHAEEMVRALGPIDNLTKLTDESTKKLHGEVGLALQAYRALKRDVPPIMQAIFDKTAPIVVQMHALSNGMAAFAPTLGIHSLPGMSLDDVLKQGALTAKQAIPDVRGAAAANIAAMAGMKVAAGGFAADLFSAVPGAIQAAIQGGGSKLQAAGSAVGAMLFGKDSAATKSITGGIGRLFGADGFLGKTLSSAVPVIGALIGPALDSLLKLFGDHAGKDIKKTGQQWGTQLSDGLVDQIKADSKKFGGEVQGMFLNLDKIIAEAGGVTAFGVDKAMSKLHDVFTLVGTHQLTVAQGTKVLDANFAEIAKAGTDSYGRIGAKLKELIALDDQFKTHSKAVADFLKTQGGNALSGFAGVVGAATPYADLKTKVTDAQKAVADLVADGKQGSADWKTANDALTAALGEMGKASGNAKQELDDLGIQAVASFSAAVAAGVPWNEALTQIGPSLKTLKDDYAALGLGVEDVALKTLLTQSAMATAAPQLMAGVAGLSQEFIALDNLSAMTPENFAAMERTGERMFARLQTEAEKAGGGAKDALLPMQDYLHQAEDAAKKYGFAIDEGTQALIDQSKEQGIWKEEGETANDIMIEGFSAIITAVGGEIPKAWQHMADEAKKAAAKAAQAAEDEAARAQRALDSVTPPDITGHYSYDFDGFNGPQPEQSARGSFIRPWGLDYLKGGGLVAAATIAALTAGPIYAASGFAPRGTDTVPAMVTTGQRLMLTPGEGIVSTLGMSHLGIAGLRAYNRGEVPARSGSGTITPDQITAAVAAGIATERPSLVMAPGAVQINSPLFANEDAIEQSAKIIVRGIQRYALPEFKRLKDRT